jgi:protein-disulfide isomerase
MENNPMPNVESWVDSCLASLNAGEQSDPAKILSRLQNRERTRVRRNRLIATGILGSLACLGVAAVVSLQTPKAPPPPSVVSAKIAVQPVVEVPTTIPAAPAPVVSKPATIAALAPPPRNFKESGSPTAPATLEIYSDYECPPCATFFADTMPLLVSQYVDAGKLKLLRRDFPLPQHKYANLAARYANAAGILGQYDAVSDQIFRTQPEWHQDGDVDRQVAAVLSPELMQKLHELLNNNTEPAESIARDRATGADDHLQQTPGFVYVANGKRRTFNGKFTALKSYLDEMLEQQ